MLKLQADEAYFGRLADESSIGEGYTEPRRSLHPPRIETRPVEVTADDGSASWGEALAPVAPDVPATVVDLLLAPTLLGMRADRPRVARSRLRDLMRERGTWSGAGPTRTPRPTSRRIGSTR